MVEDTKMDTIEELRTKAREATAKLYAAEAIERDKANAGMIGKCFKYANRGGGSDQSWWLYMQVIRSQDGGLIGRQFQVIPLTYGDAEVRIEERSQGYSGILSRFMEIPLMEYSDAWLEMLEKVSTLGPVKD